MDDALRLAWFCALGSIHEKKRFTRTPFLWFGRLITETCGALYTDLIPRARIICSKFTSHTTLTDNNILERYYSLRPILLFASTDVSTTKMCLDTYIFTKSIMGRRGTSVQFFSLFLALDRHQGSYRTRIW
jgi:hypothetical protein